MKLARLILLLCVLGMVAGPAWAGNIPEFDAVGCDATNVFAQSNFLQYGQTIANNIGPNGPINLESFFPNVEFFNQSAGQLFPDPCFPPLLSALTDAWNEAVYEWYIVLQMKPESDINLNIYDCVLKHNFFSPWGEFPNIQAGAEQTGRYRAPWGQLMFVPSANPIVSVSAEPGPFATPGFGAPFIMDARPMPGLAPLLAMNGALYTSKAIWDEALVMVLPETGGTNQSGQTTYNLKQGDRIRVTVEIPPNNTVDLRYGQDSVILKYIGITGTWYYSGFICDNGAG